MKKILHVIGYLGVGGDTTAVSNVQKYILKNNLDFQFDYVTHEECNLEYVEKMRKLGSKVYILPGDVRKMGPFRYMKLLSNILKKDKYDAIHFHTSFQSAFGLIIAKKYKIRNRICHSHTTRVQRNLKKIFRIVLPLCRRIIKKNSTKLVACSKEAGDYLFGKKSNYQVIHNGLNLNSLIASDVEVSNIKKRLGLKKDDIIIGQVGRISDMKNPLFTLELASKINNDKYKFIFLGDGSMMKDCMEFAEKKKLNNVFFLGRVSNVYDYMSIFDFLLLPSKYGEGLPVVLIEQQLINSKCLCICNSNVSKESNLGRVKYLSIDNIDKWIEEINNYEKCIEIIDKKSFDINNTATEWLSIYD